MITEPMVLAIACSGLAAVLSVSCIIYVAAFSTPAQLQKRVDSTHHISLDALSRLEQIELRHSSMKAEVQSFIEQLEKQAETLESRRKAAAAKMSALKRKEQADNGADETFDVTRLSKPQLRTYIRVRRQQGAR